jgi:hypothetical protein
MNDNVVHAHDAREENQYVPINTADDVDVFTKCKHPGYITERRSQNSHGAPVCGKKVRLAGCW